MNSNDVVRIFRKHRGKMLAFIRSRISREDAEDVLQDVFRIF